MTAPSKEDPELLALRTAPRPVKRLNRKMIIGLAGSLALTASLATMWAFRERPSEPATDKAFKSESVAQAEGLERLPQDYASLPEVPRLGSPVGLFGQPEPDAQYDEIADNAEDAAGYSATHFADNDDDARAAKAPVFFDLEQRQRSASSTREPQVASTENTAATSDLAAVASDEPRKQPESPQRQTHSTVYAADTIETPRSPFQVMAGTLIRAALMTAVNSDLPGQMIATVIEPVFDSVTGLILLIPQGSRLLGEYDSEVSYGQRRVHLVWTRLVMPDGSSINLEMLPAVDAKGQSGLEDKVNWHWGRILSGAALSTFLGVGSELAAPERDAAESAVIVSAKESVQETADGVGQEITRRNLTIAPSLTIRAGAAVQVLVNKDLVLRPYGAPSAKRNLT